MTEHEKNDLGELKYIDDDSVEELSHDYPMLGRKAKKRILEQCLAKTAETDFDENGITVSGTEVYRRPIWTKIAGTAAAAALRQRHGRICQSHSAAYDRIDKILICQIRAAG